MSKTVVVLGAGFAGLSITHYLLRSLASTDLDLKVILVSPTGDFFWNLASPRYVIPGLVPEEKMFFPVPKLLERYPADKYEFILGKAESMETSQNSLSIALNDGSKRTVVYHTAIIATGSRYKSDMPWKSLATSEQTRAALGDLQSQIKAAKSIVVGGAGTTGVEFAGELGCEFAKAGKKQVTIIAGDNLPLDSSAVDGVRQAAKNELENLGVRVVVNAKVASASTTESDGQTTVKLALKDGTEQTLEADLYIPTHGLTPNTEWAPDSMKAAGGRLHQDKYLRVPGHDNVFVLGDAGNLQHMAVTVADAQVQHFASTAEAYFRNGQVAEYKPDTKAAFGISIGRNRGTGQAGTWKIPSIMIWWFKSRNLGLQKSRDVAEGSISVLGKKW